MYQVLLCWCDGSELGCLIMKLGHYSIDLVQANDRVNREIIRNELTDALELLLLLLSFFISFLFFTIFVHVVFFSVNILNLSLSHQASLARRSSSGPIVIFNNGYGSRIVAFFRRSVLP